MDTLDRFFWVSGIVVWLTAGLVSLLFGGEKLLDWVLLRLRLKRDFLLWCFERMKAQVPHD